jgi:hypothetical protein
MGKTRETRGQASHLLSIEEVPLFWSDFSGGDWEKPYNQGVAFYRPFFFGSEKG